MSTAMQVFMGGAVRPADAATILGADGNIKDRVGIPNLSIAGKKFSMNVNGESTILTKTDPETGEKTNMQFINVVVVAMNPNRSRTYFAKAYVSGENQAPACYSSDGKTPDKDVATPFAATCASCPNSVKGSKIKEGREGYACESKKRLAVLPAAVLANPDLKLPPMQLILPMTSIWDKENKQNDAEMWFAFDNYVDDLRARGVKHTGEVITRIKFDNTEYPKLLFKAVRWLDDAEHAHFHELAQVKEYIDTDGVKKLLHGKMYDEDAPVSGGSTVAPAEEFEQIDTAAAKAARLAAEEAVKATAAAKAKATAKAAQVAAAKAALAAAEGGEGEEDGFGEAAVVAPVAKPVAKAKAAKAAEPSKPAPEVAKVQATGSNAAALAALAAEWDA